MAGRADNNTHAAAVAKVAEVAKHAGEFRIHVAGIIDSPEFKGSHRAQVLLKYIVERSLQGQCEDLRERIIGVELFGRSADYDTGEDAIVRVAASDLRKRLVKFYENGGRALKLRIDLPAGSYVPDFRGPVNGVEEPVPGAAVEEAPAPAVPQPGVRRLWTGFRVSLLFTLVALAAGVVGWAVGRGALGSLRPAGDFVSAAFQGSANSVQVIFSDEALVQLQVLSGSNITLQQYEDLSYLNAPELARQQNLQRLLTVLSTRQIVSIGDVENAYYIRENLRARGWDVTTRHARLVNARDFRNGNFIILGSSFSNPWASLFQIQDSSFPLENPRPPGRSPAFVNRRPSPGEPPAFGVELNGPGGTVVTHALVSLVDNASRTGRVLLVAGQSLSATEMAGQFLLRRESASRIRRSLNLSSGSPLPNLEMVLRVVEVNQIGNSVELAACRRIQQHTD